MEYKYWLGKLLALPAMGSRTFEAVCRLDERLQKPHRSFRSVHIAGTNGKGSVAHKIAEALRAEGYRVGLYTSPHISSVRERIQINGQMISEAALLSHLPSVFMQMQEELSFFDVMTALSFLFFQEEKIDWAVIEVGLGGRLDATNVINADLSVITSIGYDHMAILGSSLEEIAKEKGGIIRKDIPLIAGPAAAPFFFSAQKVMAPESPLYDEENSAIARAALSLLKVSKSSIDRGVQARPKCRFEQIGRTILDVAHNPNGFQRLVEALKWHFPNEKFHFIVGFSKDKEWKKCLEIIRPFSAKISFVNAHPRLVDLGGVKRVRDTLGKSEEREVICGSFYLMAEARRCLGILEPADPE